MKIDFNKISIKELAAAVSRKLKEHGVEAVLVGGACVTIYSENRYQSKDLDLITYSPMASVKEALAELAFVPKNKRQFIRNGCPFYLEFLAPPIAIGDQSIDRFKELKTSLGTIKMLTPLDCVKDRLAAFFFWDDYQSLSQAVMVAKNHAVDLKELHRWSKSENYLEKYKQFKLSLKK